MAGKNDPTKDISKKLLASQLGDEEVASEVVEELDFAAETLETTYPLAADEVSHGLLNHFARGVFKRVVGGHTDD